MSLVVNPVWLIGRPSSIDYITTNLKQLGKMTSYSSNFKLDASQENSIYVAMYENGWCQCKKAKEETNPEFRRHFLLGLADFQQKNLTEYYDVNQIQNGFI